MNIKNTTRVFWGLVIAAAFTLAACNQPNNTKTPTVNDDELGLKAKVLEALETNATTAGITFDKNSTTATVTNEVLLSNLFSGVELGDLDNVAITVKAAKEDAKTVEFDKDHGKFTVANAKDTTKGDTFVVTVVLAKDKKTTTVMFKVLNKKGVTAAPVPQEFAAEAVTEEKIKALINGYESQSSLDLAQLDTTTTNEVKLPTSVTIGESTTAVTGVTAEWSLKTPNGATLAANTLTISSVTANTDVVLTVTLKKDGYNDKAVDVTLHTKNS